MSEFAAPERENAQWQALIGKAIAFFGEIELISIKCLAHIPSEAVAVSATRMDFSRRADLLLEILEARSNPSVAIRGLIGGFKRARELAQKRNLIAHNPVMLELYVNQTMDDGYVERSIRSARGGAEPFRLENLKEFAAEVEDLASYFELDKLLRERAKAFRFAFRPPPLKRQVFPFDPAKIT